MSSFTLVFAASAIPALKNAAGGSAVFVAFTTAARPDGDPNFAFEIDVDANNLSQTFPFPTGLSPQTDIVITTLGLNPRPLSNERQGTPRGTYFVYIDPSVGNPVAISGSHNSPLINQIVLFNTSVSGVSSCLLTNPQITFIRPFPLPSVTMNLTFINRRATVTFPETSISFFVTDQGVSSTRRRVIPRASYVVGCSASLTQRFVTATPAIPSPLVGPIPVPVPTPGASNTVTVIVIKSRC